MQTHDRVDAMAHLARAIERTTTAEQGFAAIVDAARALGFHQVRLELASPDNRVLSVVAAHGYARGHRELPVSAEPDFLNLSPDGDIHIWPATAQLPERINVPLLVAGRLGGRLYVEREAGTPLDSETKAALLHLATLAGAVESNRIARSFDALHSTTLAIASIRDRKTLLNAIVEQAVRLLRAESGGIYQYKPKTDSLEVVADYRRPDYIGNTLRRREGLAGQLIDSGAPYAIVDDYNSWDGRAAVYQDQRPFAAVIEVPLRADGATIGILYVDDSLGRLFTELDARLLACFAAQATVSLQTSERLGALAHHTQQMMDRPGELSLQERLTSIAASAKILLNAETSGLFLVSRAEIVLEASVGHRGEFEPGKLRRPIHDNSVPGRGLMGYLAHLGEVFNSHGDQLTDHRAASHSLDSHTPSGHCYSLLAVPLKSRDADGRDKVIGILRADNKKAESGKPGPDVPFPKQDEWVLELFGQAAVAAIENARLLDFQKRLIESSPVGIISVDREGHVTRFNERAQELLEYGDDEVQGTPVARLYADEKEPRRIGKELHAHDGLVRGYKTFILTKSKRTIPILHSSSWLFEGNGRERIGSVGYFQDLRPQERVLNRLAILHQIGDYVQSASDIDRLFLALLTGVTAEYGLAFNRAVLLLVDEAARRLIGQAAVGELDKQNWEQAWQSSPRSFQAFLQQLDANQVEPTTMGRLVGGVALPLGRADIFSEIVEKPGVAVVSDAELDRIPDSFVSTFKISSALGIAPLVVKGRTIGLLVVDNKFNAAEINREDCDALGTIASTAAVGIANKQLLNETSSGAQKLVSFYDLSSQLVELRPPSAIPARIVEELLVTAKASWVSVLLIDKAGRARNPISFPRLPSTTIDEEPLIRPDGISMQVMASGKAETVSDVDAHPLVNHNMMRMRGARAAVCLPLSLVGRRIGVVWVHYSEPRRFPDLEVAALQLYVNQAAIAYDASVRFERLEALRQFSDDLATHRTSAEVIKQIANAARSVLEAEVAIAWFYDRYSDNFLAEKSAFAGRHDGGWSTYSASATAKHGTPFQVLKRGLVTVDDIEQTHSEPALTNRTREFLRACGGRSFMGVPLQAGTEVLGVLLCAFQSARSFDSDYRTFAQAFANRAALAIKNANLMDQIDRAKKAIGSVASVAVMENRASALRSLAAETRKGTDCDAVTLFEYDRTTAKVRHPPAMSGVKRPKRLIEEDSVDYDLVEQMLELPDRLLAVEDVRADARFKDRLFVDAEGIESCVAIPLVASGSRLGVMFLSYRSRKVFLRDELENMLLFANLAAGVIRNLQLNLDLDAKRRHQQVLARFSQELLAAKTLKDTMNGAVNAAAKVLESEFCNLVLPDRLDRLIFKAAVGWEQQFVIDGIEMPKGRGSQTGYTIELGQPIAVDDFDQPTPFEVPAIVRSHGIRSGLSVPMWRGGKIVGAMLVHTRVPRRFSDDDKQLLGLLADETAIAIESKRQEEENVRHSRRLKSLYQASKALTAQLGAERRQVFDQIVELAVHAITEQSGPKRRLGTLELFDQARSVLILESAYPRMLYNDLIRVSGRERRIPRFGEPGKLGITGRAAVDGTPQLIPDVDADPDYLRAYGTTRSELAVPLLDGGRPIGVLNIESDQPDAFDHEDREVLLAMADLAVVAIKSTEQLEELARARRKATTRASLALMGQLSRIQRHDFATHVGTVKAETERLRQRLGRLKKSGSDVGQCEERLGAIERLSDGMLKSLKRGLDRGVYSVAINVSLIQAWVKDYSQHHACTIRLDCRLDEYATVLANDGWLRAILDIVANNALAAKNKRVKKPQLLVGTREREGFAEIYVADKGRGIPREIKEKLFEERVVKSRKAPGLGIGLVMAKDLLEEFGGEIRAEDNVPRGTIVTISLPIERSLRRIRE